MKALRVVIIVICVLAVILFGVAWYFSSMLLYVAPEKCTKAHFVYCNDPSEIGLDFKNVEFKTSDGLTLRGGTSLRSILQKRLRCCTGTVQTGMRRCACSATSTRQA